MHRTPTRCNGSPGRKRPSRQSASDGSQLSASDSSGWPDKSDVSGALASLLIQQGRHGLRASSASAWSSNSVARSSSFWATKRFFVSLAKRRHRSAWSRSISALLSVTLVRLRLAKQEHWAEKPGSRRQPGAANPSDEGPWVAASDGQARKSAVGRRGGMRRPCLPRRPCR